MSTQKYVSRGSRTSGELVGVVCRYGYVILASVVVSLVFVQVYMAGAAVFVSTANWVTHRNVGHLFSYPLMMMVLLSIVGRMPRSFIFFPIGLYGLYALQYAFLRITSPQYAFISALHAANALVLAVVALAAVRAAKRELR